MVFHMFPPKPICEWTHHFSGIESLDLALVCSVHILIFSRHLCSFVQMSFTVFPGSTTLLKSIQFINLIKFSLSKCGISWDTSEILGFAMISWYNPIFFWWSAPNSKDFMVAVPARRPLLPARCRVASRNSRGSRPALRRRFSLRRGTETGTDPLFWGDVGRFDS